jgi:hypothetical protein
MDEQRRSVFVASGEIEAQQVQAFLEASGIPSVFSGESLRKTHGLTLDGLGMVNIFVSEVDEAASIDAGAKGKTQSWPTKDAPKTIGTFTEALVLDMRVVH